MAGCSNTTICNSVYPPLHPLLLSLVTHPFAFSIPFIRSVNLLFFVGSALLIFLTALLFMRKKKTVFLPLVFVGLFITSPLVIYYSSVVMKELPGAFFTILTIFFYGAARKKQTFVFFLFSAFSLTLLFLTKYNYGIVCLSGLLIEYGLLFAVPGTKKLRIFMTISMSLFVGIFGVWIYRLGGVVLIKNYIALYKSFAPTVQATHDFGASVMFYPKSILYLYSSSIPIGVLLLIGFFLSVVYLRYPVLRVSFITSIIGILLPTVLYAQNLQERFILPVFPLFLLTSLSSLALTIQTVFRKITISPVVKNMLLVLMCVYGIWIVIKLPTRVIKASAYAGKSPTFNQADYRDSAMWFNYNPSQWPSVINPQAAKPSDVYTFIFSTIDVRKPIQFVGRSNEFSEPYTNLLLSLEKQRQQTTQDRYSSYVVTIKILPESKLYTKDFQLMNAWTMDQIKQKRSDPTLTKIAEKTFEDIGVVAQVFGK